MWEEELTAESSEPIQDFEHQPVSRAKKVPREILNSEAECEGARDGLHEGYFRRLKNFLAEEPTRESGGLSWFSIGRRHLTGILWSWVQDT